MRKIVGDIRLMVKCCMLYYQENLNQSEISKILGISRPTVSRLLKEAKEIGIIKIKIENPLKKDFHDLERLLEKKFNLIEMIIVEDQNDVVLQKQELGKAVAKYLDRTLKDSDIVGISMGTTVKEIAVFSNQSRLIGATFVPLIGGVGQTAMEIHPNQIVMDLARAYGGKFKLLHAPAVISDEKIKNDFSEEKEIKHILEIIHRTTIAIVGIGVPTNEKSTMMATGYFDERDMENFKRQKAVGDICLQFYNQEGKTNDFNFNKKVFGMEIENLKKIPRVIGVAAGNEKAEAILGAIIGGYINTLVVNHGTALKLLDFILT